MTYKELACSILSDMTKEQQEQDVTVFVRGVGEFYTVTDLRNAIDLDQLDEGQMYLAI